MAMVNRKQLHKACRTVLSHAINAGPIDTHLGICSNVAKIVDVGHTHDVRVKLYQTIAKYAKDWPEHSGDEMYPISERYLIGKWDGPNKEARIRLLKYLIRQTR